MVYCDGHEIPAKRCVSLENMVNRDGYEIPARRYISLENMENRDGYEIPAKRYVSVSLESETKERSEVEAQESEKKERSEVEGQESKSASVLWKAALTIGAVAGTALLAWGLQRSQPSNPFPDTESDRKDRKTMKKPGGNGDRMYRDDFEDNPRKYFADRRRDKKANRK